MDTRRTPVVHGGATPAWFLLHWLVDVAARTVEVHTEPTARREPRYRTVHLLGVEDTLTTPALPKLKLPLAALFGRGRH